MPDLKSDNAVTHSVTFCNIKAIPQFILITEKEIISLQKSVLYMNRSWMHVHNQPPSSWTQQRQQLNQQHMDYGGDSFPNRLAILDPTLRMPLLPGAGISRTDYSLNATSLTALKSVASNTSRVSSNTLVLLETLPRALHMCRGIHCIHPSHRAECTILKPWEREIHNFTLSIPVESTQRKTHVPLFYNHYLCEQPLSMKLLMGITELSWETCTALRAQLVTTWSAFCS